MRNEEANLRLSSLEMSATVKSGFASLIFARPTFEKWKKPESGLFGAFGSLKFLLNGGKGRISWRFQVCLSHLIVDLLLWALDSLGGIPCF